MNKLFRPESSPKAGTGSPGSSAEENTARSQSRNDAQGPGSDVASNRGDPAEQAAARRLQEVIQRMAGRDRKPPSTGPATDNRSNSDRRRDW
jgi:hypothetical protein